MRSCFSDEADVSYVLELYKERAQELSDEIEVSLDAETAALLQMLGEDDFANASDLKDMGQDFEKAAAKNLSQRRHKARAAKARAQTLRKQKRAARPKKVVSTLAKRVARKRRRCRSNEEEGVGTASQGGQLATSCRAPAGRESKAAQRAATRDFERRRAPRL